MPTVFPISTWANKQIQKNPIGYWFYLHEWLSVHFHDFGASVPTFLHIASWIAFLLWGVVQIQVYKVCQFFLCFNRVPVNKVNAYLKRNPVMAKAWENAGWQLDKP